MKFINRKKELTEMDRWAKPGGFVVLFGRRRVGKTCLLNHWLQNREACYSQAIESSRQLQIDQVMNDFKKVLNTGLRPTNWIQFFELLDRTEEKLILCLDEFPYLVDSDPSLPSVLQRFWDHKKKKDITLFLCGSSQKMMHSLFLKESSALFGRASRVLKVEPMDFWAFCKACKMDPTDQETFLKYSLVGGLPKYWEYVDNKESILELADILYFERGAILEREPHRILDDERVDGIVPLSVLEAIGRGAHRPSEIGSRLESKQSSLSKVLALLLDASLIVRETPFGISSRDSKKSLYKIEDPSLRFWFSVYSTQRSLWQSLTPAKKHQFIHLHASLIFESEVRRQFQGQRYWSDLEEFGFHN